MNREILFKAKRKDSNEWVYGYYMQDGLSNHYIIQIKEKEDKDYYTGKTYRYIEVVPETVSQYTGLKDINGVKIFENDAIKEGCNGLISSVIWDNKIGTYKLKDLGDYYIKDASIEWEVIGNIFNKGMK